MKLFPFGRSKGTGGSQSGSILVSQQQYASIFQAIADGVIVFDDSGKISFINPAASTLTEWPAKDALNIDVHLVMKVANEDGRPLAQNDDLFAAALSQRQHVSRIVELTGQKGKKTIISIIVSPVALIEHRETSGGVAVFRDITEQRQEEKQRAEFISTASHEMRTPVAAIEGYLALALNDKVSTIDDKAREYLEKAHEATDHLGKLFQDLLTSAKAEDGRLTNHPTVLEMGEFLEKLTSDLRFAAEKKNLGMEFVIGAGSVIDASNPGAAKNVVRPLYYVYVDPDRLREVVTNLFDNAVKYTEHGKISIGLTGDPNIVQMYVHDTGAGIPADDIPHLFQKFYRVDNSATRTIGGTGLGLFISKRIINLYNGQIWVDSKLGAGSTFYINLPRLKSDQAELMKINKEQQSKTSEVTTAQTS